MGAKAKGGGGGVERNELRGPTLEAFRRHLQESMS